MLETFTAAQLLADATCLWISYSEVRRKYIGVEVDIKAGHIGIRYWSEIGVGDVKATFTALSPLLQRKGYTPFLPEA